MDSTGRGVVVTDVELKGAAEAAGIKAGDGLVSIGEIPVSEGFGPRFRSRYGRADGQTIPVKIRRDGRELTLSLTVRMEISTTQRIIFDPAASPRARRVRRGILTGRVDP
jgi:S1-C subfamily serine protease